MLRYLKKKQDPQPSTENVSTETKKKKDITKKKCEKSRYRNFLPKWRLGRPWLKDFRGGVRGKIMESSQDMHSIEKNRLLPNREL